MECMNCKGNGCMNCYFPKAIRYLDFISPNSYRDKYDPHKILAKALRDRLHYSQAYVLMPDPRDTCEETAGTPEWQPCESCASSMKGLRKEFLQYLGQIREYSSAIQWFYTRCPTSKMQVLRVNMPRKAIVHLRK